MTDTTTNPVDGAPESEDAGAAVGTAPFKGESFRLNDEVSDFALLEFAEAVDAGLDTGSYAGMAALIRFVVECVHPDEQARFRQVARREKVGAEELLAFLRAEVEAEADHPTGPSADSSGGREITAPKSDANSDASVSRLTGRPDLQLMVDEARRRKAAA